MSWVFGGARGCVFSSGYVVVYGEVDVHASLLGQPTMCLEVTAGASDASRGLASTCMWSPRPPTRSHKLFVASKQRCNVQRCYLRRREMLLLTVLPWVSSTTQGSPGPMSGTKVFVSRDGSAVASSTSLLGAAQPHTYVIET